MLPAWALERPRPREAPREGACARACILAAFRPLWSQLPARRFESGTVAGALARRGLVQPGLARCRIDEDARQPSTSISLSMYWALSATKCLTALEGVAEAVGADARLSAFLAYNP